MSEKIVNAGVIHLADSDFNEDKLKLEGVVLVDFWAEWCGPCKMVAPILDEIAVEYTGKLIVAKLNVDDHTKTAPKFGIRGIPTMILFKDGEKVAVKVGALSKTQLKEFLKPHL
ncbi:thioredoxin TrxA [Xenorhabdus budapestensis]|uniref:Thioredoxin n=1 Tax=Xenorhabdus budapestensis TaxID=290110 RepID=A0A2D0J4Z1_XENBU|nr:thioredoxin TrxA [Xenorhabdus budapestensis]PHM29546.1 thioredoxin [Xenorhabdus budapestensis]QTL39694.1 thioredoxin TrxA [Xenorhabdus budapestensis]